MSGESLPAQYGCEMCHRRITIDGENPGQWVQGKIQGREAKTGYRWKGNLDTLPLAALWQILDGCDQREQVSPADGDRERQKDAQGSVGGYCRAKGHRS